MRLKEHVEEDIELIILVNSERVIEDKLLREASQSFVKIGEDALSFLEEKLLLDMVSWESCREIREGGRFIYNNLEK